eukprot:Sdes_comp15856_c0_seq1m4943
MTNAFGKQPFSLYFSFLTGIRYSSSIQKCTLKPVGLLVEGRGAFQVGTFFIHKKFGYRGVIASREDFSHRKKLWLKIHKPGLLKGHNQPFYTALVDVQDFNHADNLLYFAQEELIPFISMEPLNHPYCAEFFSGFEKGKHIM